MKLNRKPEREVNDRVELNRLLDEQLSGVLAAVADGRPAQIPIAYVRDGDRLLLHGSTGAGTLRSAAAGVPVSFCVQQIDALRLGYNGLHHSMNYRSAIIEGVAQRLDGDEHWAALEKFVDLMIPGRSTEIAPMTSKDAAKTMTLALPIIAGQWLLKVRGGELARSTEAPAEVWQGIVPLTVSAGAAVPASGQDAELAVPDSVRRFIASRRPAKDKESNDDGMA